MTSAATAFEQTLDAIRNGGDYEIKGLTLTVGDVTFGMTREEADLAWDAIDEGQEEYE